MGALSAAAAEAKRRAALRASRAALFASTAMRSSGSRRWL
jgi:hypothetical protein